MAHQVTIAELRAMQVPDLRREIRSLRTTVQKMRLEIGMNTEKDTARYRRERRLLARMLTVMTEKIKRTKRTEGAGASAASAGESGELKGESKSSKISARKKRSS